MSLTHTAHPGTRLPDPARPSRWLGGLGIAFTVLYAIAFVVLDGSQPSLTASPAQVVSYYASRQGSGTTGVICAVLATIAFAFFAGAIRNALDATDGAGRRLATVATVGAAVYTSGLLLMAAIRTTLLDAAHHHQPDVAHVLNYLDHDNFFPMVAGLAMFFLATGIAIVRTAALPAWLGWAAVGVGVLAAAGPLGAIATLLAPIWTLAAAVVLLTRAGASDLEGKARS